MISVHVESGGGPMFPDAMRGAVHAGEQPEETPAQLDAGLLWWPCGFCDTWVLVAAMRQTRERCRCGAVRFSRHGQAGWRRGEEEVWFL